MFKTYSNKSSLLKRYSRYLQGGKSELSGNKIAWWERTPISNERVDDILILIDTIYHKRPDLVAYDYYGSAEFEWVVLQSNNIIDLNEEFIVGKTIKIPSRERVIANITTKSSITR